MLKIEYLKNGLYFPQKAEKKSNKSVWFSICGYVLEYAYQTNFSNILQKFDLSY